MKFKPLTTVLTVTLLAVSASPHSVRAESKNMPGGTLQIAAVEGRVNAWVFNGTVRVKIKNVADPKLSKYWPYDPKPGNRYLVVSGVMSNGKPQPIYFAGFTAYLTDADGITVVKSTVHESAPRGIWTLDGYSNLPPGGATKLQLPFEVAPDFVPVKILLVPLPRPGAGKPIRITL